MRNYLPEAFRMEDQALEQEEKEIAIKEIQSNIDELLNKIFQCKISSL